MLHQRFRSVACSKNSHPLPELGGCANAIAVAVLAALETAWLLGRVHFLQPLAAEIEEPLSWVPAMAVSSSAVAAAVAAYAATVDAGAANVDADAATAVVAAGAACAALAAACAASASPMAELANLAAASAIGHTADP